MASSAWNCSKDLPPPGSTITLGPVGTVAQAPRSGTRISNPIHRLNNVFFLTPCPNASTRRRRWLRRHRLPASRTLPNVRVVPLRVLAVEPGLLGLNILLDIRLGRGLGHRWRRVSRISVSIRIGVRFRVAVGIPQNGAARAAPRTTPGPHQPQQP